MDVGGSGGEIGMGAGTGESGTGTGGETGTGSGIDPATGDLIDPTYMTGRGIPGGPSTKMRVAYKDGTIKNSCMSSLAYLYTNSDCNLINKDNEMVDKYCQGQNINKDGSIDWKLDRMGIGYCTNQSGFSLSQDVENTLTCGNGTDIQVVPPVYTLFNTNDNNKPIKCPSGYCMNDKGELNMRYINEYIKDEIYKHPFCPN